MMPAPAPGYAPPGYGYPPQQQPMAPPQPGYGAPPAWNGANAHPSTLGHNDYPSPGEIHLTQKQFWTRIAVATLTGIIIGGIIMFRLFPIFVKVLEAASGA